MQRCVRAGPDTPHNIVTGLALAQRNYRPRDRSEGSGGIFDVFVSYDYSLLFCCLLLLAVVFVVSFARVVVFVVFVLTDKNLKPTKTYKNLQNLQEPTKTYKNKEMNINT